MAKTDLGYYNNMKSVNIIIVLYNTLYIGQL